MSEEPSGIFIFIEGVEAGLAGEDPRLCPYDKMTKEAAEWHRGQRSGCLVFLQAREEIGNA